MKDLVVQKIIEQKIYLIRRQKVMLDSDLASLYRVDTRTLNQAVKRNKKRFPSDFIIQLTKEEDVSLRSQIVTSGKIKKENWFSSITFCKSPCGRENA